MRTMETIRLEAVMLVVMRLLLVVLVLVGNSADAQRTHARTCECEHTKDGRCAYTLMLPASGGGAQCSTSSDTARPDVDDILNGVRRNATALADLVHHHGRTLSEIQTAIMLLQSTTMTALTECVSTGRVECNVSVPTPPEVNVTRPNITVPDMPTMPPVDMPTMPPVDRHTMPPMDDITMPPIDVDMPTMPPVPSFNVSMNMSMGDCCVDVQRDVTSLHATINTLTERVSGLEFNLSAAQDAMRDDVSPQLESMMLLLRGLNRAEEEIDGLQAEVTRLRREQAAWLADERHCVRRGALMKARDGIVSADFPVRVTHSLGGRTEDQEFGALPRWDTTYCFGEGGGGFGEPNGEEEYIQYDFGVDRVIWGVLTLGRQDYEQWITTYKVMYAVHTVSTPTAVPEDLPAGPEDHLTWRTYQDPIGEDIILQGNTDQSTAVTNMFWEPIRARYVRIMPLTANNNRNKCFRADLIGCLGPTIDV